MDSISFMHTAAPVLAPTMLDGPSSHNLDLLCARQSGAALFCENYAKLYFDAKHLERDTIGGGEIFGSLFFKRKRKMLIFANIESCLNFP